MNCKYSKEKLLEVAKQEFLDKGYKGVSLRNIAKKCNLSTGAIYGNFSNKEELFNELIKQDLPKILKIFNIARTKTLSCNKKVVEILKKGEITNTVIDEAMEMYKYMYENRESFILLYSSKGTRYDKLVSDFTKDDINSTKELYKKVKGVKEIKKHVERILNIIAGECFKGTIPFLIEYENFEKAKPYLELYIKCYIQSFLFLVKE